jgi:membrane fusion protein (multidrug efflux system)
MKQSTWVIAGGLALLFAAVGAGRAALRRAPAAPAAPPPPEVAVLTVAPETVAAHYEYVGQAEASRRVEVRSQVTGVIVARPYVEGTDVAQGTLLFRIDPTTYEAAYRSAQARLANAQRNLARLQPLLAARAVAQKDVDDAQTAVDQAQAAFDQAKKDYDDTFVRAEITGRAGRAQMELGARVTGPSDLLTTVEQVDPIYVNFSPSDQDILRWSRDRQTGQLVMPPTLTVQVVLADGTVLPATGKLNFVDLALQPETGTQELRAVLPNPKHALLPGQFVRVRLLGLKRPGAILVPQRAVQQGLGGAFVYVVNDSNTVAARNVVATSWDGGSWLIEDGLRAGDRVVVDGTQKAAPGAPVKPVALQP